MFTLKNKNARPPKGLSQGVGNGLCGIYIWLNAIDYFSNGALKRSNTLLEDAFEQIAKYVDENLKLGFSAAGHGLDFEPVLQCVLPVNTFTTEKLGFSIEYKPFENAQYSGDFPQLCDAMQKTLNANNTLLLLGLENYYHYTLAHSISRTHIRIIDSYGMTSIPKSYSGGMDSKNIFNINPEEISCIIAKSI